MDGKHFSVVLYLFMVSDETVHFTLSDFKVYTRNNDRLFLSDEGPMLETLDYTICIGSTPTSVLYFDSVLYIVCYSGEMHSNH